MGANDLEKELQKKLRLFTPAAEMMPAVVIVQQLEPFLCIYMSRRGLQELGISMEELKNLGSEYLNNFFSLEDSQDYLEKLKALLSGNDPEESFSFFQQVRFQGREDWIWHLGSTRIFFQDEEGHPTHIVTTAVPINNLRHLPNKAERLLAERDFYHTHEEKFLRLGRRETEVLKLVAMGKSSAEISAELFISVQTVNTHRKSIRQKLEISSNYDLTIYAHAFDLL